ncbi:hypothetical protein HMPREF0972_00570 [Actinomyces sp. oral taxon 848 str. F0332]|nr:hypothetical protein HMPREF0972_00570 [Actinomyces sp. oral taxon 848 str. F0332]
MHKTSRARTLSIAPRPREHSSFLRRASPSLRRRACPSLHIAPRPRGHRLVSTVCHTRSGNIALHAACSALADLG